MDIQSDLQSLTVMNKSLPLTVVLALLIQLAGALVWATHLEARVENVEKQSIDAAMLNEKFARLDERLEYLKREIEGVNRQMEQMNKRLERFR